MGCTHKNMLMYYLRPKFPKSPESECHKSDPLQKIISCLRVNEIDPTEVSALQKSKSCLRDNETDPIEVSALQKSKSCLRVKEIDPIEVSALQKINLPQGHRNRPHPSRHPEKKKGKNQNPKESLKTEGQKAIPYNQESKTTIAI